MFTDDIRTRPYQAPPKYLPDAMPRFFVGADGKAMVQITYPRNPHSRPIMLVTPEIAAEFADEWAEFIDKQEALAPVRVQEVSGE
jgi:hypothetical protein